MSVLTDRKERSLRGGVIVPDVDDTLPYIILHAPDRHGFASQRDPIALLVVERDLVCPNTVSYVTISGNRKLSRFPLDAEPRGLQAGCHVVPNCILADNGRLSWRNNDRIVCPKRNNLFHIVRS